MLALLVQYATDEERGSRKEDPNMTRRSLTRGLVLAGFGVAACSSATRDDAVVGQKATQASSVTIRLEDPSGRDIGSCAGTLVAPRLVLTAGHCVVTASTWTVEGASGARVAASRAVTPWKNFGSDLSHPQHADVALLVLDDPIAIAKYPGIATSKLADGAKAVRLHRASSSAGAPVASDTTISSGKPKGFRLAYTAEVPKGEWLDTGGALLDPKTGKIHGVVSSLGKKTGLLYITRIDGFGGWISDAIADCGGSTGGSLAPRGYPSSSSGGSSSGDWGGGDWGGYGGEGKKIDAGPPPSSSSSKDGGASSASDGGSNTGGGGGTPSTGGIPNENGETGSGAGGGETCPPKPSCEGECPGAPGSSSTTPGSPGSKGGADEELECQGPPTCPEADSPSCNGSKCGGCAATAGCVDDTMDYGECACGASGTNGNPDVLR